MTWNFNIDEAPKGGWVEHDTGRTDKDGNCIMAQRYETVRLLAASKDGKTVTTTRWIHEKSRWEMFGEKETPIAWMLYPSHPGIEA